jgi:hypothetical protein
MAFTPLMRFEAPVWGAFGDLLSLLGLSLGFAGGLFLRRELASLGVLLLEPVYPAFRINQLLPAREKRMAAGANFYAYIAFVSRTRLERGSARADNIHFFVGGMNPGFHVDYGILSSEGWGRQKLGSRVSGPLTRPSE